MRQSFAWSSSAVLSAVLLAVTPAADQESPTAPASLPPPVQLTTEQDHKRMTDPLGITSLRRGPAANPASPNPANLDEAKANPYPTLPDPLILKNGKPVTSADVWWKTRRAEIVEDFDREIYGRALR